MVTEAIVDNLIEEQERAGMSVRSFARHLEIDPTVWSRIRRGERGMGREVMEKAFRRYPHLAQTYAHDVTVGSTSGPEESRT